MKLVALGGMVKEERSTKAGPHPGEPPVCWEVHWDRQRDWGGLDSAREECMCAGLPAVTAKTGTDTCHLTALPSPKCTPDGATSINSS